MSATPHVSVVIATIDRPVRVARALESVLAQEYPSFDVVVVDQSRGHDTRDAVEACAAHDPRVRYVHRDTPGLSAARNDGARRAAGEILAFLDDDAVAAPGWLAAFAGALADPAGPVLAAGRIEPDWEAERPAWYPPALLYVLGVLDLGDEPCELPPNAAPAGGNLAVRRDAFERVGGFDPAFGFDLARTGVQLAGEDTVLAARVRRLGLRVAYVPGARIRHLVAAHKLTPRRFLQRFVTEGRTFARASQALGGGRIGVGREVLRQLSRRGDGPRPAAEREPTSWTQRAMNVAGRAAFAAGIVADLAPRGGRGTASAVRQVAGSVVRRVLEPPFRPTVLRDVARLGTGAAWNICPDALHAGSVVYSFGIGEDVSFDLELVRRFGCTVHAFDPTPRAIAWLRAQSPPAELVIHEYGVAARDAIVPFHPPQDAAHVSHTLLERPATAARAIHVPVKRLATIARELGHGAIDLLKMDVEGAEYEVLEDMVRSGIRPAQLLVEFHHRFPGVGYARTRACVRMLRGVGYDIFAVSESQEELSLVYEPALTRGAATP